MNRFPQTLIALSVATSMAGCAVVEHGVMQRESNKHSNDVDARFVVAQQAPVAARAVENEGIWVNKRSVHMREDALPAVFRSQLAITFASRSSLKDVANLVSRETGLRFAFAPDIQQEAAAPLLNAGYNSDEELRSMLSRITAQANLSWKYTDGSVEIYRFETKVFQIAVLPGTTEFSSTVSNRNSSTGSGQGGSSSTSGQDSRYTVRLEFWKGVANDLKGLVGSGGAYSVSETNQTVTVTGTPQVLASVEGYVKNLNAMRMRQVAIDVRAYAVEARKGADYGVTWEAVYNNLTKDLNVSATTPANPNIGLGILSAVLGQNASSMFANSKIVVNALSSVGNTTVAAESSQVVLSGESVPVSSLRKVGYLAEVQTTSVVNSGAQTSLKQATETEGFAMTLTPSIISGDYVQINGVIDLSSIDKFVNISSGGQTIQTPDVSTRSLPIKIGLKSGETYVFGLRQNQTNSDDSGVAGASQLLTPLGGNHGSKTSRKTIVVTVTTHIINPQNR